MAHDIVRLLTNRPVLTDAFRRGLPSSSIDALETADYHRNVSIEPLVELLRETMERFTDSSMVGSDAWLAPRVHAALRLSRSEASDKRVWWYLAVDSVPDYVRWRFPGDESGTPVNRFFGGESKQALARLWWSAEFFRSGHDYRPVESAMRLSDVPNSLLMDYFHNRPMALGAIRVLATLNGGGPANSDEQTDVLQAANMMATTTMIDTMVPDKGPDSEATAKWIEGGIPDWTLMLNELPEGPEEDGPDPSMVDRAEDFLRRAAAARGLPKAG